jgi:Homeodomain-like domain
MMVSQVRDGISQRAVARSFRVSLSTVQRWLARAGDLPLAEVDWVARPAGCRVSPLRTKAGVEQRVLVIRRQLRTESDLGEYGPEAIQRELQQRGARVIPAVATIARILSRRGALDGRQRVRRQAPPPGWFLSDVAAKRAEMDNFDGIEDLVIRGGIDVNVLTGISLHGGLCAAWPAAQITAKFTVDSLLEHWREVGLPHFAKFDNGTVFQGPHQWPDTFGRVTRMCLSLQVTPVFAPPLCRGFQAEIEAFNRRWQDAVWSRFLFDERDAVVAQSNRFVVAHRRRYAVRIEDAPDRRPFPKRWRLNLQHPLTGTVIYVKETNAKGQVAVLGHTFNVSPVWINRLVRADVDLTKGQIRFYALRRKDPHNHLLLATHEYKTPTKRFKE